MPETAPLDPSSLVTRSDTSSFTFSTTSELDGAGESTVQRRVLEAIRFGVDIRQEGYNLFVMGPTGIGKHTLARKLIEEKAKSDPVPSDWCYLYNFDAPHKPRAVSLPAGRGGELRETMRKLVEELKSAIPAVFDSEEYRARMQEMEEEFKERQEEAIEKISKEALDQQIKLIRTPQGFAFAPVKDGAVVDPQDFAKLAGDEQEEIKKKIASLQERMQELMQEMLTWAKESRERVKAVSREFALAAVGRYIDQVKNQFSDHQPVVDYLDRVQVDILDNVGQFQRAGGEESRQQEVMAAVLAGAGESPSLDRYTVNLIVDHAGDEAAPVITENNPTYQNLVGRIEQKAQMGALVTDFTLIKAGAMHRANGGYLLLDARKILIQPYAWEALKMALSAREIRIESLGQMLSLVSTISLEPETIPLSTKVVLLGDRTMYYLLLRYDPDFQKLFKVNADFDDRVDRDYGNGKIFADLIAGIVRRHELRHLDRDAVGRVLDEGARMLGDAERMTTHIGALTDLLREADYWAGEADRDVVTAEDVQHAVDMKTRRVDRIRRRVQEEITRNTILIDTDGERVAQINGLSVIDLGDFRFGQPNRITATARVGRGQVVDIEREVKLGGPFHSKGVLILSSLLAARYATDKPLSLSASLVFEQSYGEVDGDSASVAETCVLLSALADVPIRQSLAVTGSVNQHGDVQAIGGVNEKIEGFFDVCSERGLTGHQGVVVPQANVKHLMLRHDVVAAAEEGKFFVYAVETIDQAIELLTGMPAGEIDADGRYPENTVNGQVQRRLDELYRKRRAMLKELPDQSGDDSAGEGKDE